MASYYTAPEEGTEVGRSEIVVALFPEESKSDRAEDVKAAQSSFYTDHEEGTEAWELK